MNAVTSSGSTQVLQGAQGGSTESLHDLRALQGWLTRQPQCNTTRVLSAYVDLAVRDVAEAPERGIDAFRAPWSRIQGLFKTPRDPIGPTGLSQFVKMDVIRRWLGAREEDYLQDCLSSEARPLIFVEHPGKPLTYGFARLAAEDGAKAAFVTEGAIMRWRRETVPATDISPLYRIIYRDGRYVLKGWRHWLLTGITVFQGLSFCILVILACFNVISLPSRGEDAISGAIIYSLLAAIIYYMVMKPALRESDLRTSPARPGTTIRGGEAWIDRTNVNLGRAKTDPHYRHGEPAYRQIVRWKAECPICGSPVELKTDSPVAKGLVGGCVESPDEHSFTFDRVTLEGRPLRSKPAIN